MKVIDQVNEILEDILDVDIDDIEPETYIIRDLGAESIDLLEIAVELNTCFDTEIDDDEVFLRNLRLYKNEAQEKNLDQTDYILKKMPFLGKVRVHEILDDLDEGPVLKVKDIASYITWRKSA